MQAQEVLPADFALLQRETRGRPCYNSIHSSLSFLLQGLLDRTRLRVWRTSEHSGDDAFVAYALVHLVDGRSNRIIFESNTTQIGFSVKAAQELAPIVYAQVRDHANLFIYCTEITMALQLEKYFATQHSHPCKRLDERHINYFASPQQCELLARDEVDDLPDGFRFDELRQRDLDDILCDQQRDKSVCMELNRLRLQKLPHAAIYHTASGEMACFETVDGIGYIAPRFTRCKYSTYKLCAFVERLNAKRCWTRHGVVPAKSIAFQNTFCIEYSDRSPIWTKLLDERGCAVAKQYMVLSREAGKRLEFCESCVI